VNPQFAKLVESLAPKLDELLAREPLRYGSIPATLPAKGVYLFSDGKGHLYVGRSNSLRRRFYKHFGHPRGAAFAFLLARKETGKQRDYRRGSGGTRSELMASSAESVGDLASADVSAC
jgi:GIY-YIG catalytic domain